MSFRSVIELHRDESGQGLVEYVLILALVSLAALTGMGSVASRVNSAFTHIGSVLGHYMTSSHAV